MQFNSLPYFLFLAAALVTAMRLPHRWQNLWLVVLSYVFYAFWNWKFCGLMLLTTALGYFPALKISEAQASDQPLVAKRWMAFGVGSALAILFVFKYTNFFLDSLQDLIRHFNPNWNPTTLQILLPAGISFYVFHTISYVVDVYRREVEPTKDFVEVALFLAFFPQLIAGPIARSSSLLPQCQKPRIVTSAMVKEGMFLILIGLFRKVAIADTAGALVDSTFADPAHKTWFVMVQTVFWYSLQIYSDFAGYSDLARGSALLFGFRLLKNFDHPYISQSFSEFWRRWHISLSSWLRDYLYIPLGGNRKGKVRTYANLMTTMLLGGLWHGASWNFVFWGGLHGLYLAVEHWLGRGGRQSQSLEGAGFLRIARTFLIVSLTWIFFRSPSFEVTKAVFGKLAHASSSGIGLPIATLFLVSLLLLVDLPQVLRKSETAVFEWRRWQLATYVFAMISLIVLSGDINGSVFIYFQF